jgi:ribose transport system substrate-binding protein
MKTDLRRRTALQLTGVIGGGMIASLLNVPSRSARADSHGRGIMGNGEQYIWGLYLSTLHYWVNAEKGLKDIGSLLNVSFKRVGTTTPDAPAEVQALEQGISGLQVPGIIVSAAEDQVLAPFINQQIAKGIPVVTMDAPSFSSRALSHIGTSNTQAGFQCGQRLIKQMGGAGKVLLTRATTISAFALREQGFREAVKATAGKVEIVAVVNDYDQSDKSVVSIGQALQAHPDVQGVMTLSAGAGLGTVKALDQSGKQDTHVGVFSNDPETYKLTLTHPNLFAVAQDGYKMGYFAGLLIHIAHAGVSTPNYDFEKLGISPLPPSIDTGINFVDSTNANSFIAGAT